MLITNSYTLWIQSGDVELDGRTKTSPSALVASVGPSLGGGTARKPHRDFAGYRTELRNRYSGGHTIILDCQRAAEQGAPLVEDWAVEGGRYQVLCNAHSTNLHCTSMPKAREALKDPMIFCLECRHLAGED